MFENKCKQCLHKEYETPKLSKCPECGAMSWLANLDGPCMVIKCGSCGCEVIGASFFPPCSSDETEYTITISSVDKSQKVKLARILNLKVIELQEKLNAEGCINKTGTIDEITSCIDEIINLGVKYEVFPDINNIYPAFAECKHRFF